MRDNFCFIANSINFKGDLPFEIIPDHWFRKATAKEIQRIKKELDTRNMQHLAYELKFIPKEDKEASWESVPLAPDEWRYYVISFRGYNDKIHEIEYSANLLEHDIDIVFTFISHKGMDGFGKIYNPYITSVYFADPMTGFQPEIPLQSRELHEINTNYNAIMKLDKDRYHNIFRAISDFHQTKMITNRSSLKVLSYFSIIECLLTHVPRPLDTIDSLTHQVSSKMSLLSKRFQRNLDYARHFPQLPSPEKAWNKLYSYRSTIAHGGDANFKGEYSALSSRDIIHEFLKESLKLLLLYTLREPDFVADLQKC